MVRGAGSVAVSARPTFSISCGCLLPKPWQFFGSTPLAFQSFWKSWSPNRIGPDNLQVLLVPWINKENEEVTLKTINKSQSRVVMGHLELKGFKVNEYVIMEHGFDYKPFS